MELSLSETFTSPIDLTELETFLHQAQEHNLRIIHFSAYPGDQREPSTLKLTAKEI